MDKTLIRIEPYKTLEILYQFAHWHKIKTYKTSFSFRPLDKTKFPMYSICTFVPLGIVISSQQNREHQNSAQIDTNKGTTKQRNPYKKRKPGETELVATTRPKAAP